MIESTEDTLKKSVMSKFKKQSFHQTLVQAAIGIIAQQVNSKYFNKMNWWFSSYYSKKAQCFGLETQERNFNFKLSLQVAQSVNEKLENNLVRAVGDPECGCRFYIAASSKLDNPAVLKKAVQILKMKPLNKDNFFEEMTDQHAEQKLSTQLAGTYLFRKDHEANLILSVILYDSTGKPCILHPSFEITDNLMATFAEVKEKYGLSEVPTTTLTTEASTGIKESQLVEHFKNRYCQS